MHPTSRKIGAWNRKGPSLCSQEPHDRPRVRQDAKVEAPRAPNNKFGHQKEQYMLPKMPRITSLKAMSNGQGPAAEGVAHNIIWEEDVEWTLTTMGGLFVQ